VARVGGGVAVESRTWNGVDWIGLVWLVDVSGTMGMPTAPVAVN